MSSSDSDQEFIGGMSSPDLSPQMMPIRPHGPVGPFDDPVYSDVKFPVKKKDKKQSSSTPNGTGAAEEKRPEEPVDTSKLEIKVRKHAT